MTIITSSFVVSSTPQADGRIDYRGSLVDDQGSVYGVQFLAAPDVNPLDVLQSQAALLNEQCAARDALAIALGTLEIPLTRLDFLKRVTSAEWASFVDSPDPAMRHFLAAFEAATAIHRNDPMTQAAFVRAVELGIINQTRKAEILA